jgi:hypothetical protein
VFGPTSPGGCNSTRLMYLAQVGHRSARARCCHAGSRGWSTANCRLSSVVMEDSSAPHTKLTCRRGAVRYEPGKVYLPRRSGAAPGSAAQRASSVAFIVVSPCWIISATAPATSFGKKSAIHTSRQLASPSAKTWIDALWWVNGAPRADQAWR